MSKTPKTREQFLTILGLTEEFLKASELQEDGTEKPQELKIRTAYRQKALESHPDKNPNDQECVKKFREIVDAYENLLKLQTDGGKKCYKPTRTTNSSGTDYDQSGTYGDWFYHSPAFRLSTQAAHISKMCILALDEEEKYFGTLSLNGSALNQTPNAIFMLTRANSASITRVDISDNQLIKVNPKFFVEFKNLKHFRCNNNFIKAFPHEMLLAENLKTVECFDNEDGLYDNKIFQELWDKGVIVSADENAVMAENQDENTQFDQKKEVLDEVTAKVEKDKQTEIEDQYKREKDRQARAFRVFKKSEMRREEERDERAKARGDRKDMGPSKLKNNGKIRTKMSFLDKHFNTMLNRTKANGGISEVQSTVIDEQKKPGNK